MTGKRNTNEFKLEAVRQVTEHGRPVDEVAQRLASRVTSLCLEEDIGHARGCSTRGAGPER
jgi:transposase-like protein